MKGLIKRLYVFVFSGIFLIIMGFSYIQSEEMLYKNINFSILNNEYGNYITIYDIENAINLKTDSMLKLSVNEFNIDEIESRLNKHPFIEKSEVFYSHNTLNINLVQEKPLYRLILNKKHNYVTSKGKIIPVSNNYTPHVIVVYAEVNKINLATTIVKEVNKDSFLQDNIVAITIEKDIIIHPRKGDYLIKIDNIQDLEHKLNQLRCFMELKRTDLIEGKYKIINLSFKNQIVCTKNNYNGS